MLWGKVHFLQKKHRHFISVQKTPPFHFLPNTGPVNDKAKLFLLSALATVAAPSNGISALHLPCIGLELTSRPSTVTQNIARSSIHLQMCRQLAYVTCTEMCSSGAARGKGGNFPPPYWLTSKNYVKCACFFHCHGTSSYHATNTLQGRRAKSHVDTHTIQPGLWDFVL